MLSWNFLCLVDTLEVFLVLSMAEATLHIATKEAELCLSDSENTGMLRVSPPRFEIESTNMAAPTKSRRRGSRTSKTSKKAEVSSLEDKLEEKMILNIETRFSSFEEKILGLLSKSSNPVCTVTSETVTGNTSGVCNSQVQPPIGLALNNCTTGASSMATFIPLENSLNDELLRPLRVQNTDEDILSLQPGQREKRSIDLESEAQSEHSQHSQSDCSNIQENTDSRFTKYKSVEKSEESRNVLSEMFGEDARTGKSEVSTGIMLDKSQSDTLAQSWRTEQPDKLTAYRENYKSHFPLQDKTEEFLKVPSLDDIVETFLIKRFSTKACFKRAKSLTHNI